MVFRHSIEERSSTRDDRSLQGGYNTLHAHHDTPSVPSHPSPSPFITTSHPLVILSFSTTTFTPLHRPCRLYIIPSISHPLAHPSFPLTFHYPYSHRRWRRYAVSGIKSTITVYYAPGYTWPTQVRKNL